MSVPTIKLIYNSIPKQLLTHSNELKIASWNNYINQLSNQTNITVRYIKELLTYVNESISTIETDKQDVLTSDNAGDNITITTINGVVKINATNTAVDVDNRTLIKSNNALALNGYANADVGTIPRKTSTGFDWVSIPTTEELAAINQAKIDIGNDKEDIEGYVNDVEDYMQQTLDYKNQTVGKIWEGSPEEYNALSSIEDGKIYYIYW